MPRLSEQELAHRRTGMGSTCVVEANGLAPWSGAGPMRLFCEKLGIVAPDDAEEEDDREADWLKWGHTMEPIIADWYERTHSAKLQLGGPVYSQEHPWMWVTLDRTIIGANKLVECKNVGSPKLYSHWDVSSPDGVPRYVRAQVTIAMHIHGARETDVAACIGGRPPHVWTVWYDPELAGMLVDGAVKFWAMVGIKTPPPLDHTPASKAYLRAKYPSNVDRVVREATDDEQHLGLMRLEHALAEGKAKANKDLFDAKLLDAVGSSDGIEGDGWKMTWKVDKNGQRRQRFTARGSE